MGTLTACPSTKSEETVWVAKSDLSVSCDPKSGVDLSQGAEQLNRAKIPILDSQKRSDGQMHVQVCGASKGILNAYLISKKYLEEAQTLGYQELKS